MADAGFPTRLACTDARSRIVALCAARVRVAERVALTAALDRVLVADVVASCDVPPFANSAMDGFALRGADLPATGERRFRLIGTALAGAAPALTVGEGECLRITTGAPLPCGADSVVIKEYARVEGDLVVVAAGETARANTRPAGEDYRAGEVALRAGRRLGAAHLGVLASLGCAEAEVVRRPRAVLLTTGDELAAPGRPLGPGQIHDSNHAVLGALLARAGAVLVRHRHVRDDPVALRDALLAAAAEADFIVTSGGVSAGEADYLPRIVESVGRVHFRKVRMRPGMPFLCGEIERALLFCLPGNPVSGVATFLILVRPGIAALLGMHEAATTWHAQLAVAVHKKHARTEFQRARLESRTNGGLWATPFPDQGSGVLHSVAEADALIVIPEEATELAAGAVVEVLPLAGLC